MGLWSGKQLTLVLKRSTSLHYWGLCGSNAIIINITYRRFWSVRACGFTACDFLWMTNIIYFYIYTCVFLYWKANSSLNLNWKTTAEYFLILAANVTPARATLQVALKLSAHPPSSAASGEWQCRLWRAFLSLNIDKIIKPWLKIEKRA